MSRFSSGASVRLGWIVGAAAFFVLVLPMGRAGAADEGLSPGCSAMNDDIHDATYEYSWVSGEFYPYEELVIGAGPPDTVASEVGIYLSVTTEPDEIGPNPYPGTVRYVIPHSDYADLSVWWSVKPSTWPGPEVTWSISCRRTPSGYLSGTLSFDIGDLDPMYTELQDGRVEVYTDGGDLVGVYEPDPWGSYRTEWLPEGWYSVLMYNGDDSSYIDFFPQWYPDTPLYKAGPANLIHVHDGHVANVDAELQVGFLDMWNSVFFWTGSDGTVVQQSRSSRRLDLGEALAAR